LLGHIIFILISVEVVLLF